ncbi:MAG: hypothetical protein ACK5GN_09735 [Pseudomonadota bacterium]|jgi:hypothetical protein
MITPTVNEAKESFAAAKNLNAALKNLLKKESAGAPAVAGFAKDFRAAVSSGKAAQRDLFIERHFESKQFFFLGAVRYAFPELVETTVGAIVTKYADDFNATYEKLDEGGVQVTDSKRFTEIVKEVLAIVESDLKSADLPDNNFMKNALLATVFELDVLNEVMKVVGGGK